jgi:hypothetical protein
MNKHPKDFPDTEPLTMVPPGEEASFDAPPAKAAAPSLLDSLELELAPMGGSETDIQAEIRKEGRICPQPTRWLEFYRVLQDAAQGRQLPAPPLTGSAWASNSPATKRVCFQAQVTWAVDNGCVPQANAFLSGLPKTDWYYGD